jgi:hypothetical protein
LQISDCGFKEFPEKYKKPKSKIRNRKSEIRNMERGFRGSKKGRAYETASSGAKKRD